MLGTGLHSNPDILLQLLQSQTTQHQLMAQQLALAQQRQGVPTEGQNHVKKLAQCTSTVTEPAKAFSNGG